MVRMAFIRRAVSAGLIALVGAAPALADELDRRHQDLLQHKDLQFEFSAPDVRLPQRGGPNWLGDFFNALGPFFNIVFWGALGAAVLMLLWFILREIWSSQRARNPKLRTKAPVQQTDWRPAPDVAKALLADADQLAKEGRFNEAVRALLHRSIEDVEKKIPNSIRKAQTSREIGGLPVLPQSVAAAFAPIIRAVEQSLFGARPLDAAAYETCRRAYAEFALPESWSGARA